MERDFALGLAGVRYSDLFRPEGLKALLERFVDWLTGLDPLLSAGYAKWRANPDALGPVETSDLIVRIAPRVSEFVGRLFDIGEAQSHHRRSVLAEQVIQRFKTGFIRKRTLRRSNEPRRLDLSALEPVAHRVLSAARSPEPGAPVDSEYEIAQPIVVLVDLESDLRLAMTRHGRKEPEPHQRALLTRLRWQLAGEPAVARALHGRAGDTEIAVGLRLLGAVLDIVDQWLAALVADPSRGPSIKEWISLKTCQPTDHGALVPHARPRPDLPEVLVGPLEHRRQRADFKLTDPRMSGRAIQWETDYCIFCHQRDKDSCSKGLHERDGSVKRSPQGVPLVGCPLGEKISEMNLLRGQGDSIAALATAIIDNPMLPGTGHRICNDCMKACIYQRQQPVNIPEIETAVLTDVLSMPFGFEVYSLLTRWNPLNVRRPYMLPYNGINVLVVGLGPAGYTLAHHLANEGFGVVGIDGLKIEPLPERWTGEPQTGVPPRAVRDFHREIEQDLDERVLAGFGGVAEYGITVRWDKNFLTVLHVNLARRALVRVYGGVRFGGTLDIEDAWELGFDHIAIAAGAGRPTIVGMKNNLIRGVRKASDFLMALQLTGAFKADSLANLQLRLPVVVIGGGLTATDTATEALAYYVAQVDKFLTRYELLTESMGEERLLELFDEEERAISAELIAHGKELCAERARARREGRPPRIQELLSSWGGAMLAYRRSLRESPAYRLNHEEVIKCLEEGVQFLEHMNPVEVVPDQYDAVRAIRFERQAVKDGTLAGTGEIVELPARSVLVAAGTSPNTIYEKEHPGTFLLDEKGQFFQAHRLERAPGGGRKLVPAEAGEGFFTSYDDGRHTITFYGDNHPKYAGSVVRAMASAADGSRQVQSLFERELESLNAAEQAAREFAWAKLGEKLDDALCPRVREVIRLTPTIVEVIVRAPAAARRFRPGQFYRLQNYERLAPEALGTRLAMEGIALTGAWVDAEQGLLSLIVLEMGASTRLCAAMQPGEPVVVMGPTGAPTQIPSGEDAVLVGGGLGNAVLFSIARALKENGCRVLYFAGYKKPEDVYHMEDIEAATEQVVWSVDTGEPIRPRRPSDVTFRGNIVQAMLAYAKGELGEIRIPMTRATRIIAIGSDRMMSAVARARHDVLKPYLDPCHVGIGSINSTMQCMLKEVCAQCLQKHRDPRTGKETIVFTCFNQDQPLDQVDWQNLSIRLKTNSVQEKLTTLWLDRLLEQGKVPRV